MNFLYLTDTYKINIYMKFNFISGWFNCYFIILEQ